MAEILETAKMRAERLIREDERAKVLAEEATKPNLGLATTRELLEELRTRIEIDYYAGGGGLDYSTVKGRPKILGPRSLDRVTP